MPDQVAKRTLSICGTMELEQSSSLWPGEISAAMTRLAVCPAGPRMFAVLERTGGDDNEQLDSSDARIATEAHKFRQLIYRASDSSRPRKL